MVKTRLGAFIIGFWAGSLYAVQMLCGRFSNRMSWTGHSQFPMAPSPKVRVSIRVSFRVSPLWASKNEMCTLGCHLGCHFLEKISPWGGQLAGKVPKKQKKHGEAYLKWHVFPLKNEAKSLSERPLASWNIKKSVWRVFPATYGWLESAHWSIL